MEPVLKFVDYNDYDQSIARADQEARTARKSLSAGVFDDMDWDLGWVDKITWIKIIFGRQTSDDLPIPRMLFKYQIAR